MLTTYQLVLQSWFFCFGLVLGSFLNVVIARVPEGVSVVRPGSRCPKCGHVLSWFENVPVLSWLWLRGRCRSCKAPISARYVVVELLTGLLFVLALQRFDWTWDLMRASLCVLFIVPLVFIDAELWVLPFELTLPGIAAGVLSAVALGTDAVGSAGIGAATGFLVFRLLEYLGWLGFRKEALGAGDKYLLALIGAFLGAKALLMVTFLSSLQGAAFGIARLLTTGRAGPPPAEGQTPAEEPPPTMTWEFAKPGLSFGRRLVLLPYSLFIQNIPDDPLDVEGAEDEEAPAWVPGATNLPFGPWLGLAALEVMLLGPTLGRLLEPLGLGWLFGPTA